MEGLGESSSAPSAVTAKATWHCASECGSPPQAQPRHSEKRDDLTSIRDIARLTIRDGAMYSLLPRQFIEGRTDIPYPPKRRSITA